jgi:prolyl-tRNA synthetase
MIAYLGDVKGLILPFDLAPVQVVIVPILIKRKEKMVLEKCKEIYEKIREKFLVKLDDSDESPVSKFYYLELKGVPFRFEVGPRDIQKKQVVIVKRHNGQNYFVSENELEKQIDDLAGNYIKELKEIKLLDFEDQIELCYERDSAKEAIE